MASFDPPVTGPNPELLETVVLQSAYGGAVAKLGGDYLNGGRSMSGDPAAVFDALTDAGLLALTDKDLWGLRRVTRTAAGQARYPQLLPARDTSHRASVPIPGPQFPHKTPAGRRSSSCPAPPSTPGGQPDPSPRPSESSAQQLRWARCPDDMHLHLLHTADVLVATGGHAPAVCGQRISAEGLTITRGPSGALCMTCVIGVTSPMPDLGPRVTS